MPLVQARGITFHTQELGEGAPGVVMVHGLFGSIATWYFTSAPVLARARRVLLYDLRGHGRTERTRSGYDLAAMAGDLEAVAGGIAGNGADRSPTPVEPRLLDLVGHSYGALVALRFALDHPGRVRRLALVESSLPPWSSRELEELAAGPPPESPMALPAVVRETIERGGRKGMRLVELVRVLCEESSLLEDLRTEPDIPDDVLARVACPVLCVYGDRSPCLPAGERLSRVIPGARLAVLPGTHYLHLDAAAALSALLLEFLDP
jgi:pimeloyl-ACP methyl ester carboxylesterase